MSHVSTIEMEIRDLEAVKAACKRLGFTFMENQTTYRWYGRWVGDYPMPEGFTVEELGKCTHAIKVPGAKYEIGLVYRNGKYIPMWDFYQSGGLAQVIGQDGGRFKQAYNVEIAKLEARRKGYMVTEQVANEGRTIRLELRRGI